MSETTVMINGRTYTIACDDGQEERVRELGRYVDERLRGLIGSGAAASEMQNLVLTSIILADEIADLRDYVSQVQQNGGVAPAPEPQVEVREVHVAPAIGEEEVQAYIRKIGEMAEQIDRLSGRVAKAA